MGTSSLKPDAAEISQFMADLPRELRLDARRAVWTRFAYHYSDVRNAAQILSSGLLLSREQCAAAGVAFHDAANCEVIEQSRQAHHYVRLYFRPRTPTQYNMEGIKAPEEISNRAHCPVPVFFLFDSRSLLGQTGVWYSNGSLAKSGYQIGDTAEFLARIPFDAVYHDSAFPRAQRDEIVFRRHAEVLTRDRLDLSSLVEVVCRSGPERTTLLSLLGTEGRQWANRVRLERPDESLFFKRGVYVTGVTLIDRRLVVQTTASPRQFQCTITMKRLPGREVVLHETRAPVSFRTPTVYELPAAYERLGVEFAIGDALAYRGAVSQRSLL